MITEAYVSFFKKLAQNNNRDWFHEHKAQYEKDAKGQFITLLDLLIPEIRKLEPMVSPNPKDALFRINRDIRFSKDKTPYNTILKAGFSAAGKKSQLPGYYLGIDANHIHVGGGLFMLDSAGLKQVRGFIADNVDAFLSILDSSSFGKHFDGLLGEQAKRLDKSLHAAQEKTPYIANKQFYTMANIPLDGYLSSEKIITVIMDHFKAVSPLNNYLNKAIA